MLKIRGNNDCGRGVEGTGFLFARDRLMTNAHVVAGVDAPNVLVDGDNRAAEVVYYNPDLDIAVLAFDSGDLPALDFVTSDAEESQFVTDAKDGVAILGYPQDGPYDVERGRVRSETKLKSPDIYGEGTVLRNVYSLRGSIRPGNSGGPIVTTQGHVAGVVFAASVTDADTGYALTWDQVARRCAGRRGQQSRRVHPGLRRLTCLRWSGDRGIPWSSDRAVRWSSSRALRWSSSRGERRRSEAPADRDPASREAASAHRHLPARRTGCRPLPGRRCVLRVSASSACP